MKVKLKLGIGVLCAIRGRGIDRTYSTTVQPSRGNRLYGDVCDVRLSPSHTALTTS